MTFTYLKCVYVSSRGCCKNSHRLSGLKPQNLLFYSSKGQESNMGFTWLKLRFQQGCIHLGSARWEAISYRFQPLEATHIPWLAAPSLFKASSGPSFSHPSALSLSCLFLSLRRTLGPPRQSRIISSRIL